MKTLEISNHKIELYDSINEMPIKRYNLMNLYILKDAGIGATAQDISEKFKTFFNLLKQKDYKGLQIEATNIAFSLNAVIENISFNHNSFLCFVYSIDGEIITGIENEATCKELMQKISNWLTVGVLNENETALKKKINKELKLYFPKKYSNVHEMAYLTQLRSKTDILLKRVISGNPGLESEKLDLIERYFIQQNYPKELRAVADNVIIEQVNSFELLCTLLEENGIHKPKELTVYEFMAKIDYLEKKYQPKESKKHGH